MPYDAIIIGGSFAGLSAAMQLVRARRPVLLIDAGLPRNRFAKAAHGFLGQDGVAPAAIVAEGLKQLRAYPTVAVHHGVATAAAGEHERFTVSLGDGGEKAARRLILATGVRDVLPSIPGLDERWGESVLHCPYCHGYEVAGRPLGVLANHARADEQALLIADWGPTTLFTQGRLELSEAARGRLAERGVAIELIPVVALLGPAPALDAVRLADGRTVPLGALFTAPQTQMASPLAEQLGCAVDEGHTGPHLRVDEWKQTTVPGVYAAGDAAAAMHNATMASAAGVLAGVGAHHSLLG
ncbi:NAD(P)/FAD-dependent oxidoreductase [Chelatococcus reniformis]|uniref:Thioredoxin reductase n=1 Tax=Chelatococcus reniformis TaxID=1494448 RepID=A0A916U5C2_9HYPH|nr:NAD(P)/FAD-dependent oxidoreductase [Chelatococcus reniformis]GGC60764.1 hypothetical protein GCM10010994_19250 [Chelatococcus reniformis]